jgi:hypothetical protein
MKSVRSFEIKDDSVRMDRCNDDFIYVYEVVSTIGGKYESQSCVTYKGASNLFEVKVAKIEEIHYKPIKEYEPKPKVKDFKIYELVEPKTPCEILETHKGAEETINLWKHYFDTFKQGKDGLSYSIQIGEDELKDEPNIFHETCLMFFGDLEKAQATFDLLKESICCIFTKNTEEEPPETNEFLVIEDEKGTAIYNKRNEQGTDG